MKEEKYITYKEMIICTIIFVGVWFLNSLESDRLREKIHDLDKRLTRTEAICYGTGQTQTNQ
jgi:hypothetical protein